MMPETIKPSWTLKSFLLISSLSIIFIGINSFINFRGVEIFNAMCLVVPFFSAYAWLQNTRKIVVYLLLDLHFIWWVLLAFISAYSESKDYFYVSLAFIFFLFYRILQRKENYVAV